ncbi:MAG: outer membrane beta-barrel domain-containing protein [Pseudomonadota bacterium]|nr:outer membrane beta-barrel domain-containing protein [Pseudomonadota bacterium]
MSMFSLPLLALAFASTARAEEPSAEVPAVTTVSTVDLTTDAVAQDEEDPAEEDSPEDSVKSERDSVKKGAPADAAPSLPGEDDKRRRIIKTIQKKNFMKIHRYEVGPSVGFVANDPFLNRYIIGGVFDYHLTEVFAAELQVGYAPILGQGGENDPDWKDLSKQLLLENSVSPDISKLTAHGSMALAFSPIYGKAAVGRSIIAFDIFGYFGLGVTATTDDLVALQNDDDSAVLTQNQVHPTTIVGGGARVAFSEGVAARVEGKSMSYIETVNSTTLEMKNNFVVQASVSFFFPGMK